MDYDSKYGRKTVNFLISFYYYNVKTVPEKHRPSFWISGSRISTMEVEKLNLAKISRVRLRPLSVLDAKRFYLFFVVFFHRRFSCCDFLIRFKSKRLCPKVAE